MLLRVLEMVARRGRRSRGVQPVWMALSLAIFLLRRYQQKAHQDEIALREELRPGETLLITHTTQPRG